MHSNAKQCNLVFYVQLCPRIGKLHHQFHARAKCSFACALTPFILFAADCENINFDALLLAGHGCHVCLPELCANGGKCVNVLMQGYSCDCSSAADGFTGDHCDIRKNLFFVLS